MYVCIYWYAHMHEYSCVCVCVLVWVAASQQHQICLVMLNALPAAVGVNVAAGVATVLHFARRRWQRRRHRRRKHIGFAGIFCLCTSVSDWEGMWFLRCVYMCVCPRQVATCTHTHVHKCWQKANKNFKKPLTPSQQQRCGQRRLTESIHIHMYV